MKSERTKACDLSKKVKDIVWERDERLCVLCGRNQAMPNAHYIPRSKGGLGIPENVVTLCIYCHDEYDKTSKRGEYGKRIRAYLKKIYPNWDESKLVYKKDWGTDERVRRGGHG